MSDRAFRQGNVYFPFEIEPLPPQRWRLLGPYRSSEQGMTSGALAVGLVVSPILDSSGTTPWADFCQYDDVFRCPDHDAPALRHGGALQTRPLCAYLLFLLLQFEVLRKAGRADVPQMCSIEISFSKSVLPDVDWVPSRLQKL